MHTHIQSHTNTLTHNITHTLTHTHSQLTWANSKICPLIIWTGIAGTKLSSVMPALRSSAWYVYVNWFEVRLFTFSLALLVASEFVPVFVLVLLELEAPLEPVCWVINRQKLNKHVLCCCTTYSTHITDAPSYLYVHVHIYTHQYARRAREVWHITGTQHTHTWITHA